MTDFEGYLDEQFSVEPQQEPEAQEPAAEPEPEPEPTEAPETEAAPEQPELILGKYRDVDALAEAYKNLEREKGRLAQELGEARQYAQQPQPQQQVSLPQADDDQFTDPQYAANYALQAKRAGDELAYERAVRAWGEYDPLGAARFDARISAYELQQQQAAQYAPSLQAAQQYTLRQTQEAALNQVAGLHPDFAQVVGQIDLETLGDEAQTNPALAGTLRQAMTNPDQTSYAALFETLYLSRAAQRIVQVQQATSQAAADAETQAATAKQRATVASASSTPSDEGTGDKELDAFYDYMRAPDPTSWVDLRPAS